MSFLTVLDLGCASRLVSALKRFVGRCRADLKIKSTARSAACMNDHGPPLRRLRSLQNERALRGASAVLLKLKGGDHVLLHVASTCYSARRRTPSKKRRKVYITRFTEGRETEEKRERRDRERKRDRNQAEKAICKTNTERERGSDDGDVANLEPPCRKLIADIANHIMNLIGRTISPR